MDADRQHDRPVRLYHGDCIDFLKTLPDESVDAVITDPPYNCTPCKWDNFNSHSEVFREFMRIAKPQAAILVFGSAKSGRLWLNTQPQMFRLLHERLVQ